MKRIAYIPARSGSKGIPKKNIQPLCGKPLMGWMIEAALKANIFDRVMVSTDTEEFAEIARNCGAWVPFLRDPAVATDTATTIETMCSDKARLEAIGETFDVFCLLQPTAPLCRAEDIVGAIRLFEECGGGVVSVRKAHARLSCLRNVSSDCRAELVDSRKTAYRRQEEPGILCEVNGAIYINSWNDVTPAIEPSFNPYAYIMDDISSIDIDSPEDFAMAEDLLRKRFEIKHF